MRGSRCEMPWMRRSRGADGGKPSFGRLRRSPSPRRRGVVDALWLRAMTRSIRFVRRSGRQIRAKVGGWTKTRPVSLGLLPSGPDPVGERYVLRQPPAPMWTIGGPGARGGAEGAQREFSPLGSEKTGRLAQVSRLRGESLSFSSLASERRRAPNGRCQETFGHSGEIIGGETGEQAVPAPKRAASSASAGRASRRRLPAELLR